MPVLKTQSNEIYTSIEAINKIISPNWVAKFCLNDEMLNLADSKSFNDGLKEKLISTMSDAVIDECNRKNLIYPAMFVARIEMKNELYSKLNEYQKMHANSSDELHHTVNGSVIFGLLNSDGRQTAILLAPGDKLFIPANIEHWGTVTSDYYATLLTYRSAAHTNMIVRQTGTPILTKF